jgi:hypothetical protein
LEGVGPGNRGCLGSEMAIRAKRVPFGPKKVEIVRLSGIQSVRYRNEKIFDAGSSPVPEYGDQSGSGMLRYRTELQDARMPIVMASTSIPMPSYAQCPYTVLLTLHIQCTLYVQCKVPPCLNGRGEQASLSFQVRK